MAHDLSFYEANGLTEMDYLEDQITEVLDSLNERQRRFVLAYSANGGNVAKAIEFAGYKTTPSRTPEMQRAIRFLSYKYQLEHGIHPAEKRKILLDIANKHKAETPGAAVSAIRELNAMDGDNAALEIKHSGTLNVVTVDYKLDLGRVIEGEAEPADEPTERLD